MEPHHLVASRSLSSTAKQIVASSSDFESGEMQSYWKEFLIPMFGAGRVKAASLIQRLTELEVAQIKSVRL